jgi:hypothetical protein
MMDITLCRDIATICALRRLDLIDACGVIAMAERLLIGSCLPEELVRLTAIPSGELSEVDEELEEVAYELGIRQLDERATGLLAAEYFARQLNRGEIAPIDAARTITKIAHLAPGSETVVQAFVAFDSEWDNEDIRGVLAQDIRDEARRVSQWGITDADICG